MNNVEEQQALNNLMARYADGVNRRDGETWIATWAPDASWNLMGNEVTGRDNIYALWQQMMSGFEFALMIPSSCLFDIDADSASGHWYLQEFTRDLQGNSAMVLSRYLDTYRRVDGRWLYQSRDYHILYRGAADHNAEFTPFKPR